MRICLLLEEAVGAEDRAARIAGALRAADHEVVVVSTSRNGEAGPGDPSLPAPGRAYRLAGLLPPPVAASVRRRMAARVALAARPEALHVVGQSMLRVAIRSTRGAPIALVLDRTPDDGTAPRSAAAVRRERKYLRSCTALLTATETDATAVYERQTLPARPLVCRDVADPPSYSPTEANLRHRLRLRDEPLVLVHGGEPAVEQAIGAVRALAACPDVHLVVLGADAWRCADTVQLEAEKLRCAGRLHLLRAVPTKRIPAYADDADVGLCMASGTRPLLDSMYRCASAALPVIVPPKGEGEHVVGRFGFGWIADPTDCEQLTAVLELACGSERGTRQEAARRAGSRLTWNLEAQVLVGLYQRLQASEQRVLPPAPRRFREARINTLALARELRARRAHGQHTDLRAFIHHVWGRHMRARGDYARSVAHFDRALRRAPDDVLASQQRAASLKDAGRSAEAIEAYQELLSAQNGKPNTVAVNAAINLVRLGVRHEPRQVLESLTRKAKSPGQFSRAAELAAALGDVDAARRSIDRAVELAPEDFSLCRVQARVLEQSGEPEDALRSAIRCSDQTSVERLQGTLRTYDPSWRPRSPRAEALDPIDGRVLHLLETSLPHATTGYSYRTRTVLSAQVGAGLEPVVATRLGFPANRGVHQFAQTEVVEGVVHHRFTLPGVRRYTAVPLDSQLERNVEMLAPLVESVRPAALQATTPHHNGLLGLSLRAAFEVPFVYEVRGFPEMTWAVRNGGDHASVYALRRAAETRCMLEADAVVTLSGVMRSHIVSRGVPEDRVWVVPHMIDVDAIAPTPRSPELVRRYGLESRTVVGYLGTLVDYEGIDLLLQALADLRKRQPGIIGLIVGGGPAEPSLQAMAKDMGLDDTVVFAGRIPHSEVNEHVALFDMYVLPRHDYEVCRWVTPLKPYEAMASGNCVITSDVEALAETVAGGCGMTFAAGDATALAETIADLARDPELRAALGAAGRTRVMERHDETELAVVAAAPIRAVGRQTAGRSS